MKHAENNLAEEVKKYEDLIGQLKREKAELEHELSVVGEAKTVTRQELLETQKLLKSSETSITVFRDFLWWQ